MCGLIVQDLSPTRTVFAEQYDGTVWSNTANLAYCKAWLMQAQDTGTAALTFGGI
jgi:hypothetical protein